VDGEVGGDNFKLDIGYGKGEFGVVTHHPHLFRNTSYLLKMNTLK
jgi:hypothetical protein